MIENLAVHLLLPQNIFFVIAFSLSMFQYHMKSRRRMLGMKFVGDSLYSVYFFSMGAASGGLASAIAGTGSLIQTLTPNAWMAKTRPYRIGLAVMLALGGIAISAHRLTNILPLLAVMYARFFELSSSPQRVRYGMWLTFPPWMIYNAINGLYLALAANVIIGVSLTWAIWKHRRVKLVPEPV